MTVKAPLREGYHKQVINMSALGAISFFSGQGNPRTPSPVRIFVDESGDLGWQFDNPYRAGGSSRYLTVACLIVPPPHYRRPKKVITRLYKKYGWVSEKKAAEASELQKKLFCKNALDLLTAFPEIKLDAITVNKINVQGHIQQDPNKLYNYMLGLVVFDYVTKERNFDLITDERSIRVKSQNSLKD